jgi:hypothetical protein
VNTYLIRAAFQNRVVEFDQEATSLGEALRLALKSAFDIFVEAGCFMGSFKSEIKLSAKLKAIKV